MFEDRIDAGRQLAARLGAYARKPDALVLGIPRGGVIVAAEVARELHLPLDVVVVRKIGAPGNPEYAVGAMDQDGGVVLNPDAHVSDGYLESARNVIRAEIERRLSAYRGAAPAFDVAGRTVIIVDDGIATGLTALASIESVRARGAARVVLAAPVMPADPVDGVAAAVDELVVVHAPALFYAVGEFYRSYPQTTDAEVVAALASARRA